MIHVLFSPGCYGTFVSKCLYYLTDLGGPDLDQFNFDSQGSSHDFRKVLFNNQYIVCMHPEMDQAMHSLQSVDLLDENLQQNIVCVLPCRDHGLDYFDNQFAKQEQAKILEFIKSLYTEQEIEHKLLNFWHYNKNLDVDVPRWIIREWCSLWIQNVLLASYSLEPFAKFDKALRVSTQDVCENLYDTLHDVSKKLQLTLLVSRDNIDILHDKFLKHQKFHNMQKKCVDWVKQVLNNQPAQSPCLTILDEAYVQALLRDNNYEIQCHGLEHFPTWSQDLYRIIYHVSS